MQSANTLSGYFKYLINIFTEADGPPGPSITPPRSKNQLMTNPRWQGIVKKALATRPVQYESVA